jgi:hypothetical protein
VVFSFNQATIPAPVLSPLNSTYFPEVVPGKNIKVGYPLTVTLGISLAVESHIAITILGLATNNSAAAYHSGINFLQCPHQGA